MKTSELIGAALDWAVAKCEGLTIEAFGRYGVAVIECQKMYSPSTDWSQGGPIIEREKITIGYERYGSPGGETWDAVKKASHEDTVLWIEYGPTPLIAAMRCYVASKLGDEVEIPEELR